MIKRRRNRSSVSMQRKPTLETVAEGHHQFEDESAHSLKVKIESGKQPDLSPHGTTFWSATPMNPERVEYVDSDKSEYKEITSDDCSFKIEDISPQYSLMAQSLHTPKVESSSRLSLTAAGGMLQSQPKCINLQNLGRGSDVKIVHTMISPTHTKVPSGAMLKVPQRRHPSAAVAQREMSTSGLHWRSLHSEDTYVQPSGEKSLAERKGNHEVEKPSNVNQRQINWMATEADGNHTMKGNTPPKLSKSYTMMLEKETLPWNFDIENQVGMEQGMPGYVFFYESPKLSSSKYMRASLISCLCSPLFAFLAVWFSIRLADARRTNNEIAVIERSRMVKVCIISSVVVGAFMYTAIAIQLIRFFELELPEVFHFS